MKLIMLFNFCSKHMKKKKKLIKVRSLLIKNYINLYIHNFLIYYIVYKICNFMQFNYFNIILVKKYKILFKKHQKQRILRFTLINFNFWILNTQFEFNKRVFFFFYRTLFVRLKFFKKFKKKFRKYFKKKNFRFFFFCKPNFLLHEKFKNSRMGKGKGSPIIWVYKPLLNKPFIILSLFNFNRCHQFLLFFKKFFHPYIYFKIFQSRCLFNLNVL